MPATTRTTHYTFSLDSSMNLSHLGDALRSQTPKTGITVDFFGIERLPKRRFRAQRYRYTVTLVGPEGKTTKYAQAFIGHLMRAINGDVAYA